jgi:16S rRNA (uracil1498-N3)-methyltransferase
LPERFFHPGPFSPGLIRLSEEESRHLARVRRIGEGEVVEVFDGEGNGWKARVEQVAKDHVRLERLEPMEDRRAPCELTLATALPKGERLDWLIEKGTELGVARVVPLQTERSVVDPRSSKLDRLRRLVIEASKQCGRNRLMRIEAPRTWASLVEDAEFDGSTRLLCHVDSEVSPSWSAIHPGDRVVLAVGPEGGFSPSEVAAGRAKGWQVVGLGPTILRIETAAVVGAYAVFSHTLKEQREER